jgi:putative phosphoesterase
VAAERKPRRPGGAGLHIAVMADTHDKLPAALFERVSEADEIWHLGDVCGEWVLDELRGLGKPVKVVRGNCDSVSEWPLTLDLKRSGLRIRLVHIPPPAPPPDIDLVLHGHTHVPRNERIGSAVFLNPGCVTRPNRGAPASHAWLLIYPNGEYRWELRKL